MIDVLMMMIKVPSSLTFTMSMAYCKLYSLWILQ